MDSLLDPHRLLRLGRWLVGALALMLLAANLWGIALFQPLRARVQALIDRRFYRRKYDSRQVLAQFAQRAQREADLDALSADLLATVDEALKPERAMLWIVRSQEVRR